ncbi:unnamed protein product [Boreogadus saida]
MAELKESSNSLTNPKEKQILLKVISGKIIKKYRLGKYAHQEFGFSQKMMRANRKRPNSLDYHRKQQSNVITNTDDLTVAQFLERDDNSRATTGKRDTKTKKQLKMQKRLLSDSLKNLHLKFKAENPNIKISCNEEISEAERSLIDDLQTVKGTMKIHQIHTSVSGQIMWRVLSCFCRNPDPCTCFSPQCVTFTPVSEHSMGALHQHPPTFQETKAIQPIPDINEELIGK